ncbi:DNA-binding protein [Providencia rettgeri]|uniref:RNA-binding domain-containing protein n=1 Tax=Providencia rettgeri TaxID=587 RepID=UPI000E3CB511|nr:DNA-binding protein [Providencia rettgeri]
MTKITRITHEQMEFFCTQQESDIFDFKSKEVSGKKIQQAAVAFANAEGGEILVGVNDEKEGSDILKRWCGHESIEDYNAIIQALADLDPSIDFFYEFLRLEEQIKNYILHLTIRRGTVLHKTPGNDIYVRRGAQSLKVSVPAKIQELTHAKGITSEEDSLVSHIVIDDIVDSIGLKDFLNQLSITDKDPLSFLLQEYLVDQNTWTPKVSSVLLFSDNPSSIMPRQCGVRVVRYDTLQDNIDRDDLKENISVEGGIQVLISESFKVIKDVLTRTMVWTEDGEHKPPVYPDETLWEILVNALIHRDYSISDNVLISIFCNRIEFKSPGRLPGLVTVDNILDNRFSRNPKIVRLLSKYRDSPNKDLGEGMNTAFQRMEEMGRKKPEIYEDGNYVKMVLRHELSKNHDEIIINFLKVKGSISNRQVKDLTGLDSTEKVTSLFSKLREKGIITRVEGTSGVSSRWKLV